jgi:phage terminase large subunit-like protein
MTSLSLYAAAQCDNSVLVVHNLSNLPEKVYVDGSTGENAATPGVTVYGIPPGQHLVKVVAVYTDENGYTKRRTIFNGNVNFRGSRYMDAWVEEGKGISIHETPEPCNGELPEGSAPPFNPHAPNAAQENVPVTNDQQQSNAQPNSNVGIQPVATPLPTHISDDDFLKMKDIITNTKYEMKKMDTLKVLVGNTNFTTDQVGQLMNLFAFESNKLEIAKMLYLFTVDRKNYGRLAANFNFDARKEDFKKFMEGK